MKTALKERANAPQGLTLNRTELDRRAAMQSTSKDIPHFDALTWRSLFSQVAEVNGCWEWVGYRDPDGYGVAKVNRIPYRAHRLFFSLLVEPLRSDLVIDHLCRNHACVNPMHLEQVTVAVNTARGEGPAAVNQAKTHCPRGHAYEGTNVYAHGRRQHCAQCRSENPNTNRRPRTHCQKGHEWVEENIYTQRNGVKRCAICKEAGRKRPATTSVSGVTSLRSLAFDLENLETRDTMTTNHTG